MISRAGSCATCLFGLRSPDFAQALTAETLKIACRRYPPMVLLMDMKDATFAAVHPAVSPDHWCGEYVADPSIVKDH